MYLYAKLFSNVFKTLTESLVVWNCDGGSANVVASVGVDVISILVFDCFSSASSFVWPKKDTCMLTVLFPHILTLLFLVLDWSRCW